MTDIDPSLVDFDEDQNENPFVPPSPEDLSSTTKTATLDPTTSTLTVNIEMSRSTEYAKEKKSVSAFLKLALPDTAIGVRSDGTPGIDPDFLHGVDAIAQEALNTVEVAVARQHGLEVQTDGQTVRVMNLFGSGTKAASAPAPTPGPFSPPAPAAAPAPQAPAVGGTAPLPVPPQPAAAAPPVPGTPVPGAFPPPIPGAAPAAPVAQPQGGQQGGFQPSANPNAWSNQAQETKAAIGLALETFATTGNPPAGTFYNNMTHEAKYKGFKVGDVNISAKVILNNRDGVFGPGIINYIRQCEAAGIQIG